MGYRGGDATRYWTFWERIEMGAMRTLTAGSWAGASWAPEWPLSTAIDDLWCVRGPASYGTVCVPPYPAAELIINLGDAHVLSGPCLSGCDSSGTGWFEGFRRGPIRTRAAGATDLVGVRFRPAGAFRLIGIPLDTITDRVVAAEHVLGRDMRELADRLGSTPAFESRFRIFERFLAARLRPDRADRVVDAAVAELSRHRGLVDIDRLSTDSGLTSKPFVRRFRRAVGVPPKRLARTMRFDATILALRGLARVNWASFAVTHGYSDQSHLIREWRELFHCTPAEFLARRACFGQLVLPDDASL
jgi:AraC-like DNA-binding protein